MLETNETPDWIIEPNPLEGVKTQSIKGVTTKSVGFSVVYPDGETGFCILGKVTNKHWQPYIDIKDVKITWR